MEPVIISNFIAFASTLMANVVHGPGMGPETAGNCSDDATYRAW